MSSRSCCPKPRGETFKTKRPFVASKEVLVCDGVEAQEIPEFM